MADNIDKKEKERIKMRSQIATVYRDIDNLEYAYSQIGELPATQILRTLKSISFVLCDMQKKIFNS